MYCLEIQTLIKKMINFDTLERIILSTNLTDWKVKKKLYGNEEVIYYAKGAQCNYSIMAFQEWKKPLTTVQYV